MAHPLQNQYYMGFLNRKLNDIIEFFARDILSFSILLFLFAFLANHLASAQTVPRNSGNGFNSIKIKQKKFIENQNSGSLSKQLKFHTGETPKNWQLNFGVNGMQKAVSDGSQKDQGNSVYSFSLEPSFKFANDMSIKGVMSVNSYTKNDLQNDISDLLLSFYFLKTKIASNLNFSSYLTSTVPFSKDSKQRQQMNFGFGGGSALSNQTPISVGILSVAGSISAHKYFHRYETALNNYINTSYSSNQQISMGWEHKQIGATLMFRHINAWNYAGNMSEGFFHMQAFSWNANNQLSFSAGHSNSGSVLSPNQEEIEIRIIDDNSSTLFVSTNYVF